MAVGLLLTRKLSGRLRPAQQLTLNTATLLWAAAVVQDGRHVSDRIDSNAECTQRAY
jgi:hypothetical protein